MHTPRVGGSRLERRTAGGCGRALRNQLHLSTSVGLVGPARCVEPNRA